MATTKADKKAPAEETKKAPKGAAKGTAKGTAKSAAKSTAKTAAEGAEAPKKAAPKKAKAGADEGHGGEIDRATKKVTPKDPTTKKGGNSALQQPLQPSEDLAAIVGSGTLARGEVVSRVWEYIRKHNLQNPEDKREILADDKLKKVFGKDKATMFEMNKYLAQHLK